MKKLIYLFLTLIIVACSSKSIDGDLERDNITSEKNILYYKGSPYSGEIFELHKNGQLKFKGNYKDGKKDGLFESYTESGMLRRKANFKDDKMLDEYPI